MRRQWVHAAAVDAELVEAMSRACSQCESVWRQAREDADFKAVLPNLEEVLNLTPGRQVQIRETGSFSYDALLDQYEPEGRRQKSMWFLRISKPFSRISWKMS